MAFSKDDLKKLIHDKLKDYLFVVASNREPYSHRHAPKGIEVIKPASGVTAALDPVLQACNGVWIAHGSGDADKKVVDSKNQVPVPPEKPTYTLKRIWMNKQEEKGYYYGFSNEALWPLCHISYIKPVFNTPDWEQYKLINERFAKNILEVVGNKPAFVFLQDYHLTLVPKMLKEANPNLKVALFWHIPWPNPEAFRICPWKKEILAGMLGADLLGFHIYQHVNNFLDTINQTLEARVDKSASTITFQGIETLVRSYPISIDAEKMIAFSKGKLVAKTAGRLKRELDISSEYIAISVDRIDYTKGILERFRALDRFFEKYPEYQQKLTFLQAGSLSRIHIGTYKNLNDEINNLMEEINWKYSTDHWKPIHLVRRHFNSQELAALYKLANLCIVSSIHDGMNLVAKEYVACSEARNSMLLLSEFTGAAKELPEAIQINPYDTENFANAIKEALKMPAKQKALRMNKMKETIYENNIYNWAAKIINALLRLA